MKITNRVLWGGLLCALLTPTQSFAHGTRWETINESAQEAVNQGDYAEAERLLQEALAEAGDPDEKTPYRAMSLHNLALFYSSQQKYAEAAEFAGKAVEAWENLFGPEHQQVGNALSNLALLYSGQEKYAEAEPLSRRALAIHEKVLGGEHPQIGKDLHELAAICRQQGKYAEAEPLYQRALAIWEKALGPEHLAVAISLEDYSLLLRKTNRDAEAEKLEARAKSIRTQLASRPMSLTPPRPGSGAAHQH